LLRGDESDIDILEDSGVFVLEDEGREPDTNALVDHCIAQIRETARLDDHPVLPPPPAPMPRRDVVVFAPSALAIPSPTAIVKSAAAANDVASRAAPAEPRRKDPARWPVRLCALVAIASGAAAFLTSPIGHRPEVTRVTRLVRAEVVHAAGVAVDLVRR